MATVCHQAELLHDALDSSDRNKLRDHLAAMFEGVYFIAHQVGADIEAIRGHETAILMLLMNARRKRRIQPVPD